MFKLRGDHLCTLSSLCTTACTDGLTPEAYTGRGGGGRSSCPTLVIFLVEGIYSKKIPSMVKPGFSAVFRVIVHSLEEKKKKKKESYQGEMEAKNISPLFICQIHFGLTQAVIECKIVKVLRQNKVSN